MQAMGRVYLVGAGPGDPELLTLKALRLLKAADVVVYDRLVSPEVLDLAPAGAARICVGKRPHHHPIPQEEINALLARLARGGRTVVRLKGGDPLIFGRGSEEAMTLRRQGIPFEIVPGITSAQGCAAAACAPLTHRGLAGSVRYITGHCRQDRALDYDWQRLAEPETTLVVYMGLANIAEISEQLIAHGLAPETPSLVVNNGTTARERRRLTTLADLPGVTRAMAPEGPVLFIIGQAAGLAADLGEVDGIEAHAAALGI